MSETLPVYPAWPPVQWNSDQEIVIPITQFEAEGNYIRVRRLATRDRQEWTLPYLTTQAGFEAIRDFFRSYQGSAFTWVSPDGETLTVTFGMERLKRTKKAGHSVFSVVLKEI